jgi:hypothetical protein
VTAPDDPFAPPSADRPAGPPPGSGPPPGYGPPPQGYGPPPAYGSPPGSPPGYGPSPYAGSGWTGSPQTSTKGIVALILAVASFMVFPLVPAIVALVLASSARREIDESGGRIGGRGLVQAARIVAWINIGLCLLAIVGLVLLVAVGTSTGSIRTA